MMTIHELLEDKAYREFFLKPPAMPRLYKANGMAPWRVYIRRDHTGPWAKKDCMTYREAFEVFKRWSPQIHDAAITSRAVAFSPPYKMARIRGQYVVHKGKKVQKTKLVVWTPKVPAEEGIHTWCPYCRRPTIFRYFSKHHAFPEGAFGIGEHQRCTICGIRREGLPRMIGVH